MSYTDWHSFIQLSILGLFVLLFIYMVARAILYYRTQQHTQGLRFSQQSKTLPLRIQAYERMCLFLERISPANLLTRMHYANNTNAVTFQAQLLNHIREEYQHNMVQQLYMSQESWQYIRQAVEETMMLINESANTLKTTNSSALQLSRNITANIAEKRFDAIEDALNFIKKEAQQSFLN